MTNTYYVQETDSKIIYQPPRGAGKTFADHSAGEAELSIQQTERYASETIGSRVLHNYLLLRSDSGLFDEAWAVVNKLGNIQIAQVVKKLLRTLDEHMLAFRGLQFDIGSIPPLHAFAADDGSVLLEWAFRDYRVGFSIEPQIEESSWFLVTNKNLGEITASGNINGLDLNNLTLWLLNFVLSHS